MDYALAEAWGLNQANLRRFLEVVEDWDEQQKQRFIIAVGECGYAFDLQGYANLDEDVLVDPNAPSSTLPEVGDIAQIDLALSYNNLEATRYSYLSEAGRTVSANLTVVDQSLGGDYGDLQLSSSYSERIPMPWRGHHVLAARLSGGVSAGGLARRGAFTLGGLSEQQDIIRNLLNRTAVSESGVLRGYRRRAFSGRYFTVLNTEYRLPVIDIDRGVNSIPLFLERLVFVGFTDWGLAWTDPIEISDLAGSVGGSVIFDFKLGYGDRIDLFFQYAHGCTLTHHDTISARIPWA